MIVAFARHGEVLAVLAARFVGTRLMIYRSDAPIRFLPTRRASKHPNAVLGSSSQIANVATSHVVAEEERATETEKKERERGQEREKTRRRDDFSRRRAECARSFLENVRFPPNSHRRSSRYRQARDVAMTGIDLAERFYRTRSSLTPRRDAMRRGEQCIKASLVRTDMEHDALPYPHAIKCFIVT